MAPSPASASPQASDPSARKHLRGSVLLLIGRCLALAINLVVQVITVRYLSKADFGAFAFGVTMVAMVTNLSALGLPKSLARFLPIYHERGETEKSLGAVLLVIGTALGLALTAVLLIFGWIQWGGNPASLEPGTVSVLLVLIVLAPVESLDRILESLFAASGQVRSIFVRRHLLGPGLKLLAVLSVVGLGKDVHWLATCYVIAGVVGMLFYVRSWRQLRELFQDESPVSNRRPIRLPIGELARYSLPLYSSQIGFVMRTSLIVLILQWFANATAVAEFRAVFPFARLNEVVMGSFAVLFVPVASRLFARGEIAGVNDLYWRSSTWILALSLPVFVMTGLFADSLVPWILGDSYASSSPILVVLTLAFFIDAVLGFNLHTLRVFAKVWQIAAIETVSILCCLGLCVGLVPTWGAWGAALAVSVSTIVQNLVAQAVMLKTTGVGVISWRYAKFYLSAAAMVVLVAGLQQYSDVALPARVLVAIVAYLVLIFSHRSLLRIDDTFPELQKVPLLSKWIGPKPLPEYGHLAEGQQ